MENTDQNAPTDDQPRDPAQEDYKKGQEFLKNGDFAQAANAFHNALLDFEESGNDTGIANASDKLGDICRDRGSFDKALVHFQRAYEICDRLQDIASTVSLEKKMAECHRSLKQYNETLKIYFKLFDTFSDWKNPGLTVDILEQIAGLYIEIGEKERAADAYMTAASIHKSFKHPRHAQTLIDKAEALKA